MQATIIVGFLFVNTVLASLAGYHADAAIFLAASSIIASRRS